MKPRNTQGVDEQYAADDTVIIERLEEKRVNGSIHIPKEYGMFIAKG